MVFVESSKLEGLDTYSFDGEEVQVRESVKSIKGSRYRQTEPQVAIPHGHSARGLFS